MGGRRLDAGAIAEAAGGSSADLVLKNGHIYTVDAVRSWAQAIAVTDGVIVAVGSNEEIEVFIGEGSTVIDLAGRMVMPGIIDSHIHAIGSGLDSKRCVLPGTFDNPGLEEMVAAIRACDERFAGHEILYGYRFTTSAVPKDRMNRQFLDSIVGDRPVILRDEAGHTLWLNSKALALSGVTRDTESPAGGVVLKGADGEPNGVLQSSAGGLIDHLRQPEPTPEELFAALNWSMRELVRLGVTSTMDAIVRTETLPLWKSVLIQQNLVIPHLSLCLWIGDNSFPPPAAKDLRAVWDAQQFPRDVRLCAKIYGDNVLEAGTAGLLEPYANRDHSGRMNFEPAELQRIVADLDAQDIPIKTHSIGDRTAREVLNAYEIVINKRGSNELRHHLGHITMVHPDDFPRFRQLDVPAEYIGAISALIPYVKVSYYDSVGHDRFHERMQPVGGLVKAGAVVSANSDWGAGILDPMRSIQTTVTRMDPNDSEAPVAGAEYRVDLPTAIAIHTINGAYLLNREDQTGSLEVGKQADLIVLDRNLFEIPVEDIRNVEILLTLIGGRKAWQAQAVNLME